jgi:hypothetical protein
MNELEGLREEDETQSRNEEIGKMLNLKGGRSTS